MGDLKKRHRGSSSFGSSSSGDKMPEHNLSQDVLVEILSRLPTKSLIRSKSVCRTWRHLISTTVYPRRSLAGVFYQCLEDPPYFDSYENRKREGQFHYVPMSNVKCSNDECIEDPELSFLPCHPNTRIVDCRNGLLLCSSEYIGRYFICNPITRQWVPLPKRQSDRNGIVAMVFISADTPHYKIIQLFMVSNSFRKTHLDLDIYSSMTGRWVQSKVPTNPAIVGNLQRHSVYLQGFLYFLSTVHQIVRFDVKEESCLMIDLPTKLWIPVVFPCAECLGVSDGCLSYAHYDGSLMKIWSLDDCVTNEWNLKHTVSIYSVDDPNLSPIHPLNILAFHPHLDMIFLRIGDKIVAYHFPSKTLEDVCILSSESVNNFWLWVHPFSECLCSLEGTFRRLRSLK